MTHRDVIAVGASAGGVEALRAMAADLPEDLPAAVLVVLHVPRDAPSALTHILGRAGPLPVHEAYDGEQLWPGHIYVARADHHLLVVGDRVRLGRGPSENGHRPAINPLFRSVARAAGARAVAVVLSGSRDDGAAGAETVAARGGAVIVQDPADALHGSMPRAALARVAAARIVATDGLGELITRVVAEEAPAGTGAAGLDCSGGLGAERTGSCYRCITAVQAWSAESLAIEQVLATESALSMALRALEEKAALSRRMAAGSHSDWFELVAKDADEAGTLIRGLLRRLGSASDATPE